MRRRMVLVIAALISATIVLTGCAPQTQSSNADQATDTGSQTTTDEATEQLEKELGAFDITAEQRYGTDFAAWKKDSLTDVEFLDDLAKKKGVVLMYGPGFDAPEGCVRISLANLNKDDYVEIARRLGELLDEYHTQYEQQTALDAAA